jgi:L-serine dehydratase
VDESIRSGRLGFMEISTFDLFSIGIGPSSSHTVGPMKAARDFALRLQESGQLGSTASISVTLFGSLGATGKGHGSDKAVMLGFLGESPEEVVVDTIERRLRDIRERSELPLLGVHPVRFHEREHLIFDGGRTQPYHPNALTFCAKDCAGREVSRLTYYSIGGGFILSESDLDSAKAVASARALPHPFDSAEELLRQCAQHGASISQLMLANECALRPEAEVRARLDRIWNAMQECVRNGCRNQGVLPGGLKVRRRAAELHHKLTQEAEASLRDPLTIIDWVNLYALAVNEENAAGGRVVTAPTNGAAGIIPAVLHYATRFCNAHHSDGVHRFLLTAAAIGILYKKNASISGADVGCQGEVGVACSMAAGALAEFLGGTPQQVENAAEIGMEHNLGLTCDPVGGLVQIPCIERNAMGSVKAINAARIALRGDGRHFVPLDKVIKTMRDTGRDMLTKYKETARGGLAVNVVEC